MKASFCTGTVVHSRLSPTPHRFKYRMSWCLFDLDTIEILFQQSHFWSLNRFNLVSLKNQDYIDATAASIKSKACALIQQHSNKEFTGKIFLFTHPRYLGFGFNSVNFYLCYEDNAVAYILSEINNTPWQQKQVYVHDVEQAIIQQTEASLQYQFNFNKQFHISPFVDMAIDYVWKFDLSHDRFKVYMQLNKLGKRLMNVNLNTVLTPIKPNDLIKWTLKKPFQALKMLTGIYWQAFKLWIKKIPFYSHPDNQKVKK